MKKYSFLWISILVLLQACGNGSQEPNKQSADRRASDFLQEDKAEISTPDDIFGTVIQEAFPYTDSTNFDQIEAANNWLETTEMQKLDLAKLSADAKRFNLNYSLPYSDAFSTISISFLQGEHEVLTFLVTFDSTYKIIDMLQIAYDEIAESAVQKIAHIYADRIVVEDWNYMAEEAQQESKTYQLTNTGKFKMIK